MTTKPRHNFRKLEVWKESITLTSEIFKTTKHFPPEEKFGIISQMNRCSVSVPSNIAEGTAKKSDKHFVTFLEIALGSAFELETLLIISNNVGYLDNENFEKLLSKDHYVQNMIYNLIEKLEN
jgi:four helix bundle protein